MGTVLTRTCPYCDEEIDPAARRCPYCAEPLADAATDPRARAWTAAPARRSTVESGSLLSSPILAWGSCAIVLILLIGFVVSRASILDKLETARRELAASRAREAALTQRIEALEGQIRGLSSQVTTLSTQIATCQRAIQSYEQGFFAVARMYRAADQGDYALAGYEYERVGNLLDEGSAAASSCLAGASAT